jgi:hypothetical protein
VQNSLKKQLERKRKKSESNLNYTSESDKLISPGRDNQTSLNSSHSKIDTIKTHLKGNKETMFQCSDSSSNDYLLPFVPEK